MVEYFYAYFKILQMLHFFRALSDLRLRMILGTHVHILHQPMSYILPIRLADCNLHKSPEHLQRFEQAGFVWISTISAAPTTLLALLNVAKYSTVLIWTSRL